MFQRCVETTLEQGDFSVVSLLLDANSWKFKSLSDWKPPIFSCQNFPNCSHRFKESWTSHLNELPGKKKQISNDCKIMGFEKYPGEFLVGPDLQGKKESPDMLL